MNTCQLCIATSGITMTSVHLIRPIRDLAPTFEYAFFVVVVKHALHYQVDALQYTCLSSVHLVQIQIPLQKISLVDCMTCLCRQPSGPGVQHGWSQRRLGDKKSQPVTICFTNVFLWSWYQLLPYYYSISQIFLCLFSFQCSHFNPS